MSKYSEFFLLSNAEYEKIGDHLRLRRYGSWLAQESWMREEQSQKRAQFTLRTIALARKIAKEKGIEEEEAFGMLQSAVKDPVVFVEYANETSALMEAMPSGREDLCSLVTAFFKNRGEVLQGKKWVKTEDWTMEDTEQLPKHLLEQVEAFIVSEDDAVSNDEEEEGEQEAKND